MDLIFIEEVGQIDEALRLLSQANKIIAFSPMVLYALEKRGASFSIPEDYYSRDDLQKEWVNYFNLSKTIMTEVDRVLCDKTDKFAGYGDIKPLAFNAQMFFNMFRQIVMDIYILKAIFEKEKPGKVYYPQNQEDKLTYRLYYDEESVVSHLTPLFAEGSFIAESYPWHDRKKKDETVEKGRPSLSRLLKGMIWQLRDIFSVISKGPGIMVLHGGYDIDYILPLLRKKGYKIRYFEKILKRYQLKSRHGYYNLCFGENSKGLLQYFEYKGINFFFLVKSRLEFYLNQVFPAYLGMYSDIKNILKNSQSKLVLGGHSPSRVYENILCASAKELGIKVLSFQHGGYGERFNHILHINDFDNPMNDYFFVWGSGVREYAQRYGLNRVKIVPVGSAWMDSLVMRKKSNMVKKDHRKTVLYVPTSLRIRPKMRMLPGEYPDNYYFMLQRKIISDIASNDGIELLVKLHPSDKALNPIAELLREGQFNNCRVVSGPLKSLLPKADLVVSDFMSTVLIESLAMNKNIMFYIDQSAMLFEPEARTLLNEAAYCFDKLDNFLKAISVYAKKPEEFPLKDNKKFLAHYGTYLNDGRSAERAVESIEKVLSDIL